jgi:hypothetical protein
LDLQFKEDEIGGAYGWRPEMYTEPWWGNLKETDHVEHLSICVGIILK